MSFLAPIALWFGLTIPVVALFYLLKRRRVVVRVPSTVLWRRYLAETQASAPFQKLRKNWLLFLQILLLILAVLALARPFFEGEQTPSSLRVAILDASASMQSTDVSPSRFEAAKAEALRWVEGLKPGQQMVVLEAGPRVAVLQSATSDKAALRRALNSAAVSDGPTRVGEALRMAESLTRDTADAEIHLFSDGALGDLEEFENHNLPLVYHKFGERRRNVALGSLEVRPHPEDPSQRAVFCSVANLTEEPVDTTVELSFEGEVVDVQPTRLGPGETAPLVFVVTQQRDGVFTARVRAEDDLPVDNEASVVSQLQQPVNALLVTRGNRFLERALRAAGTVRLTVAADMPAEDSGSWDFVVLDGVAPREWPEANIMALRVSAPNWFEPAPNQTAPVIVDWRSSHPLLRFVSMDNVRILESAGVAPPAWGTVVVESPQGPLIIAGELGQQRIVWIGFDVLESTWPLLVSFPMFVANAADWLNPATKRAERLNVRAGEPLRVEAPPGVESVEVRPPDGNWRAVYVNPATREAVYGDTLRKGRYEARWGTNTTVFAVRALDAMESDTAPRSEIPVGRFGGAEATSMRSANLELWRWLAALALGVLMTEWWYYHRRTA